MLTKHLFLITTLSLTALTVTIPALANDSHHHGGAVYHALRLETGLGITDKGDGLANWDFNGWIGTDDNKIWLKSEGERHDGQTETSEFWGMYSRNISMFWDVQIGLRHDTQPQSLTYAVIGMNGLAPYFFETEAHLFISEDGDLSARIRQENDVLVTQRLITQPYIEANIFAQDVPELDIGAGISNAEIGLQTRYEYTRGFAPYVDIKYDRKFGETSSIAKSNGNGNDAMVTTIGLRLLF